jgi:hypothetical protein
MEQRVYGNIVENVQQEEYQQQQNGKPNILIL